MSGRSRFVLVEEDGYREREIASGETLLDIVRQAGAMAGERPIPDGGDDDGTA